MRGRHNFKNKPQKKIRIKYVFTHFIILVLSLLFIGKASAFGVGPSRVSLEYSPEEIQKEIYLFNEELTPKNVTTIVTGDLKEYIDIGEWFVFSSGEQRKKVYYKLRLPEGLPAGETKTEIIFTAEPFAREGVAATTTVRHRIFVVVHGVSADIAFVQNNLRLKIKNLEDVSQDVSGSLSVLDNEVEVQRFAIQQTTLTPKEEKILEFLFSGDAGEYTATLVLNYNGRLLKKELEFIVGEKQLEIKRISAQMVRAGEIAKIEALVSTDWNKQISNIKGRMYLKKGEQTFAFSKIPEFALPAESEVLVPAYIDATSVPSGTYILEIVLDYGKESRKEVYLEIKDDGAVVSEAVKTKSLLPLIAAILLIALIALLWLNIHNYKRLRKRHKSNQNLSK
ncbi:MAG: hypothetical protein QXK37_04365 [Candidatus Woesearchaeota archaeon]